MPEFRYYCLDPNGKILWGEHIDEPTLDAAVDSACANCSERLSGKCEGIEVWQRASKLYPCEEPSEREVPAAASPDCPLRADGAG